MKIEKVSVRGFRCFGPEEVVLNLSDDVTAFVGGNGCGKTAFMAALAKVFGIAQYQRDISIEDFYVSPQNNSSQTQELYIDVIISFPELSSGANTGNAVPECFNQMVATAPGAPLKCRIRKEATWEDDGSIDGNITEQLFWVRTLEPVFDKDSQTSRMTPHQRNLIQFVYVPAIRNAEAQVTQLLKSRLWQAIEWSSGTRTRIVEASEKAARAFSREKAVKLISSKVQARWKQLHSANTHADPILSVMEGSFEEVVKNVAVRFQPTEDGGERNLEKLSDGQKSLFHIALTAAALDVEKDLLKKIAANNLVGFHSEELVFPCLTILAVEEPENSLAPFFLSRIVSQLKDIGGYETAQVLISSHSASILRRVPVENVRYFSIRHPNNQASVKSITLPNSSDDRSKFIKEAVHAHPELYFAKFVILGEGDTEEIVLPRIADALGLALDPSFIPVVPLGGRHINHFWRLLRDLEIPFATLADLDRGRATGGWQQIKIITENLLAFGVLPNQIGPVDAQGQRVFSGNVADFETFLDTDISSQELWCSSLEEHAVYFSYPLDIDMSMMKAFPRIYQVVRDGGTGPRLTAQEGKTSTLKKNGNGALYDSTYDTFFKWYPYLFQTRSKPATHLGALSQINDVQLKRKAPPEIQRLLQHIQQTIYHS